MDYAAWMKERSAHGDAPRTIATAALQLPLAFPESDRALAPILQRVAADVGVGIAQIHVVGSTRFGFSIPSGFPFDPRYADLGLAVVDPDLYVRCGTANETSAIEPRCPERDLPAAERSSMRQRIDRISRSALGKFAYVNLEAYPHVEALIDALARKIEAFMMPCSGRIFSACDVASPRASVEDELFRRAVEGGVPRFLEPISRSNPGNASPYLVNNAHFRQAFATSETRKRLLAVLDVAFLDLSDLVDVPCCLVGGSFVDPIVTDPRDLDLVMFYRTFSRPGLDLGPALARLTRKFRLHGIDVRFVPLDSDPWLLVKITSFFTSLYLSSRDESNPHRGMILLRRETSYGNALLSMASN